MRPRWIEQSITYSLLSREYPKYDGLIRLIKIEKAKLTYCRLSAKTIVRCIVTVARTPLTIGRSEHLAAML